MVGKTFGHYEILEPLGAGGMGEVYRARDTKLDRDVAIKVLPEDFAADGDRLARFEREAKLLAQLNHSNIATIHGLEDAGGVRFIAMECVEGETLADRIARSGRIEVDDALEIARQIAEALEAAHESGIVHRDLKPANVKVTPDGKAKVLDFGLAKGYDTGGSPSQVSPDLSHSPTIAAATQTGVILGTAAYMSPEQARGKPVDKRADIWAFGCVLYETLTGNRAFDGETVSDTMAGILKEEPDWNKLPEETGGVVRRLLARCLEKDPYDRLRDIGDARWELSAAAGVGRSPHVGVGEGTSGGDQAGRSTATARIARGMPWLVAGLVAGAVLAVAIWGSGPQTASPPPTHLPIATEGDIALGGDAENPMIALSPDGRKLAYVGIKDGIRRMYVVDLDGAGDARLIRGTDGAYGLFFSPDGEWVGFTADSRLQKVSLAGGAPMELAEATHVRGAVWSPDGSTIYYTPNMTTGIWRVPSDGRADPEQVTTPGADSYDTGHWWPDILPDGNRLLYMSCCARRHIYVFDMESGETTQLVENSIFPRYSYSGHLLYAQTSRLLAAEFDAETLDIGNSVGVLRVATGHEMHAGFALSQSGTFAYLTGLSHLDRSLIRIDGAGAPQMLTEPRGFSHPVEFSPDGRRAAVGIYEEQQDIYLIDVSDGSETRLTSDQHNEFHPVWTRNGQNIVFTSGRTGRYDLYIVPANLPGPGELLYSSPYFKWAGSLSPGDSVLAFFEERSETGLDIMLYSMDGELAEPFLQNRWNEYHPRFSPDGDWLLYQSDELLGELNIFAVPYPGRELKCRISTSGGAEARWSSNDEVVYLRGTTAIAVDVSGLNLSSCPDFEETVLFGGLDTLWGMSPLGDVFLTPQVIEPLRLHLVQNWFDELERVMTTAR